MLQYKVLSNVIGIARVLYGRSREQNPTATEPSINSQAMLPKLSMNYQKNNLVNGGDPQLRL